MRLLATLVLEAKPEEDVNKQEILAVFEDAASRPLAYAQAWKDRTGGKVVGSFPMNFPGEIAHAAGKAREAPPSLD